MAPENIAHMILSSPYHVGGNLGSHMFKLEEPQEGRRLGSWKRKLLNRNTHFGFGMSKK